jgi:hypothetical protein
LTGGGLPRSCPPYLEIPMLAIVRALLLAAICAAPALALSVDEITGTWQIDTEAFWAEMLKQPEMAEAPAEQKDMMKNMMLPMMAQMRFVISADAVKVIGQDGKENAGQGGKLKDWKSTGAKTAKVTTVDGKGTEQVGDVELTAAGQLRMSMTAQGKTVSMVFKPAPVAK